MIQFTSSGVEVTASRARLNEAKEEFDRRRMLHLPGLLSAELVDSLRRGLERDGFEEPPEMDKGSPDAVYRGAYQGGKVGQDLKPGDTARLIAARTNDQQLLTFVETMTSSPPLQRCIGRVFRLFPMADDLPWHTDAEGGRLADLIINLSPVPNEGGLFQMRDAKTLEVFNEVGETAFGDGLLIRISPHIEHHYKAITGSIPKVTFSGWFVPKASQAG
jgi:hypothetical protein